MASGGRDLSYEASKLPSAAAESEAFHRRPRTNPFENDRRSACGVMIVMRADIEKGQISCENASNERRTFRVEGIGDRLS